MIIRGKKPKSLYTILLDMKLWNTVTFNSDEYSHAEIWRTARQIERETDQSYNVHRPRLGFVKVQRIKKNNKQDDDTI